MSEPAITLLGATNHMQGSMLPTLIVLHDEEYNTGAGSARAIAQAFKDPNSGGLAHYAVDVSDTQHMCPDHIACWHAPPNFFVYSGVRYGSIGIEQDGYAHYNPGDWQTPDAQGTIVNAARTAARAAVDYGIPANFLSVQDLLNQDASGGPLRGVTTHMNMSAAFHQSDHTDPGINYPITQFMNLMRTFMGQPQQGDTEMIRVQCSRTGDVTLVDPDGETFNFDRNGGMQPVRALPGLNTHPEWNTGQGHAEGPCVGAWNWPATTRPGTPPHDGIVFVTRDQSGGFHTYHINGDGSPS